MYTFGKEGQAREREFVWGFVDAVVVVAVVSTRSSLINCIKCFLKINDSFVCLTTRNAFL